jgi:chloramphenicol O-acetyltransferase type A
MSGYIDESAWPRKALADFFGQMSFPFYSLCSRVKADALYRRAKAEGLPFYMCMIYAVMSALNENEAFLYKIRADGVYRHDYLWPSFTDAAENDLFKIVNLPWQPGESMADFCRRARAFADAQDFLLPSAESEARDDLVYLSCLPWLDFTALTNERNVEINDSLPRVSWGRLTEDGSLAVSIEVNHRLIDGRHLAGFFASLSSFTSR